MHLLKRFVPLSAPVRRLFFRLDDWVAKQPVQIRAEEWLSKFEEIQVPQDHECTISKSSNLERARPPAPIEHHVAVVPRLKALSSRVHLRPVDAVPRDNRRGVQGEQARPEVQAARRGARAHSSVHHQLPELRDLSAELRQDDEEQQAHGCLEAG